MGGETRARQLAVVSFALFTSVLRTDGGQSAGSGIHGARRWWSGALPESGVLSWGAAGSGRIGFRRAGEAETSWSASRARSCRLSSSYTPDMSSRRRREQFTQMEASDEVVSELERELENSREGS